MNAPSLPDKMPVMIVSGFLGAGKTTFLNRLLGTPEMKGSLVLVNEFGDAGLDGLFLEEEAQKTGSGLMVRELTSGCLCCTLQGPLVATLEDLLRARDNGRIAPFAQLVIETTGLADPAPILGAFARHPYLSLRYLVGGILTVVDASQDPQQLDATPEAAAQIAVADVLAISKSDLVDGASLARLETALSLRNAHALRDTTDALAGKPAWLEALLGQANPIIATDAQGHAHTHTHDHAHAHSITVQTDEPLAQSTLARFMDLLAMNLPGDLLRVKGIAWIASEGTAEPWAVHAAGPLQHPARPISGPVAARLDRDATRIVVITRSDQGARIGDLFAACLHAAPLRTTVPVRA